MHGDYSRQSFNHFLDFAAVLDQQGRAKLDADGNEFAEILQRRWRAETVDIIGRCVVPQETPDGFNIRIAGVGPQRTMTIGLGRIYVDGLLAENHGAGPFSFDMATARPDGSPVGVLDELVGQEPVRYEDQQPYHQGAPLDYPAGNGPHLVYLDVWQREVTATQVPSLLEEALGGVDTTTRMQIAWQVRFLEDIPRTVTCATPEAEIPGWSELTRPSAGRLSTRTREEAQPADPCLLPPSGGYRGLENQLYRIEIHDGGTRAEATFKWSRHNASVCTRIESFVGASIIRVASLGRDEMLGFAVGDWVEVTDDRRELDGLSGEIARIDAINPDSREITLSRELPEDLIPTGLGGDTAESRHSRMVQWNQSGQILDTAGNEIVDLDSINSSGVIPVPAGADTWVQIEHGVEVSFDFEPADGSLRSGDYWMVAARTASASIETFERAPPRGIHHHYCRLAIVRWALPLIPILGPMQLDCRILWPAEIGGDNCACTVCVTAESHNNGSLTIQQAVAQVTGTGGSVCLGPGNFFLGETPINIEGAQSIRLKGHGALTALVYPGQEDDPPPAISVEGCSGVVIENLTVVTPGSQRASAIRVRTSASVVVEECLFFQLPPREEVLPMISIGGAVVDLSIKNNWIFARMGIAGVPSAGDIAGGAPLIATAGLYIVDNELHCDFLGVSLEAFFLLLGETDISDNVVAGTISAGIRAMGAVSEGAPMDISRNSIRTNGNGIVVAADNTRVTDNDITAVNPGGGGNGIVLTEASGNEGGIDRCQVLGNRITHLGGAGILIDTHLRSAMIKQNTIDSVSRGGITMEAESSADDLTIENNQIRNVASLNPGTDETLTGIRILNTQNVALVGNTIDGVAVEAIGSPSRAGIQVVASPSICVAGNELVRIGPAETGGPGVVQIGGIATGIDVVAPFDRVDLTDNTVRRSRARPNNPDPASWFAIRIRLAGGQFQFADRLALLAMDDTGNFLRVTAARLITLPPGRQITAIRGNLLESHDSTAALVSVGGQGTCVFTDNRCVTSFGPLADFSPAEVSVALAVGRAIVGNNYVEAPPLRTIPIRLDPPSDALNFFTVLGNITSGPIRIGDAPLPDRWAELNVGAL